MLTTSSVISRMTDVGRDRSLNYEREWKWDEKRVVWATRALPLSKWFLVNRIVSELLQLRGTWEKITLVLNDPYSLFSVGGQFVSTDFT